MISANKGSLTQSDCLDYTVVCNKGLPETLEILIGSECPIFTKLAMQLKTSILGAREAPL